MGSGASSKERETCLPQDVANANGKVNVEMGMQWLLGTVDKEKKEKEWLADKYDQKCTEVRGLQQELASTRAELHRLQVQQAAEGAERRPPPLRGMAHDVQAKVAGDASLCAALPSGASSSTEPTVLSPGGGALKERRGLKLQIETQGTRAKPKGTIEKVPEQKAVQEASVPDMSRAGTYGDGEPMSALLRRRSEDWSMGTLAGTASMTLCGVQENATLPAKDLRVHADKVFSLQEADGDCPASPKRVNLRKMRTSPLLSG